MSDLFGVTVDYLLNSNHSNSRNGFVFFFFNRWEDCQKRIKTVLDMKGITESAFFEELCLSAKNEPSCDEFINIARALNVSTDYLLGISEIMCLSEKEKKALNAFATLSEDNQDIILGEIKKLLKEQIREEAVAMDSKKVAGK